MLRQRWVLTHKKHLSMRGHSRDDELGGAGTLLEETAIFIAVEASTRLSEGSGFRNLACVHHQLRAVTFTVTCAVIAVVVAARGCVKALAPHVASVVRLTAMKGLVIKT